MRFSRARARATCSEIAAPQAGHRPLRFTTKTLDIIRRGPTVVEAVHVGDPSLGDPKRTLAPDITKQSVTMFQTASNDGKPVEAAAPAAATGTNEPPRSDRPSDAPAMGTAPAAGSSLGVQVVNAPNADPNAVVQPAGPKSQAVPEAEKASEAPIQTNDIKTAPEPQPVQQAGAKQPKKPKVDLDDESSSKKKKKKGLGKLNPF